MVNFNLRISVSMKKIITDGYKLNILYYFFLILSC